MGIGINNYYASVYGIGFYDITINDHSFRIYNFELISHSAFRIYNFTVRMVYFKFQICHSHIKYVIFVKSAHVVKANFIILSFHRSKKLD